MKENIIKSGYTITSDPHFQAARYKIPKELELQLEKLSYEANDIKNKEIIEKLTHLTLKHPTVPMLKNFLSAAYMVRGNHKKAIEINNWILAEHPDYLFARINKAHEYIENGEPEKVPEILGEALELKNLYPDRDIFHITEVLIYIKTTIRYFLISQNLSLAENRLELLKDIAPEHPITIEAENDVEFYKDEAFFEKIRKKDLVKIIPKITKKLPVKKHPKVPVFNHKEVKILYSSGYDISNNSLEEILALPRETLIHDLESMLLDAAYRYNYFRNIKWDEQTHTFVLHAMYLLKELKATSSLPAVLQFLEYKSAFIEFWLDDYITTTIWPVLFELSLNNPEQLKDFLLKPGIYTYSKTAASEALFQMLLHFPEKKQQIINLINEVFEFLYKAMPEDNVIDSELIGLMVANAIDCRTTELLPIIEKLYEKNLVSLDIAGDFDEVKKEFNEPETDFFYEDIYSIFDLYDELADTSENEFDDDDIFNDLHGLHSYDDEEDEIKNLYTNQQPLSLFDKNPKTNRNDLCPCGSGKKYKKCCINMPTNLN